MKIKALSRSKEECTRERKQDLHLVRRNLDPTLHPFEQAREYTRAVNAAKLDRMFAKPFVGALSGHADGVYCMARRSTDLKTLLSGSGDGEVKLWHIPEQKCTWSVQGHRGIVRGVCSFPQGSQFLSVGSDKTVKLWDTQRKDGLSIHEPVEVFTGNDVFTGVDHHRSRPSFATSGSKVDIWDLQHSQPIQSFSWGADTINSVKFNQTEQEVFASCGSDRSVILYDLRMSTPLAKLVTRMSTNALAWNPMEAFMFTTANEDHNCYTFDMRNMKSAVNVLKDHVSAVLDVDYSPTGQEIVTGSYDRSLRIFRNGEGHSRDIYHTKRMQRLFCVKYSMDSKFILSGSDDGNIRLWKSKASEKLGPINYRERAHLQYSEKLKERYEHMPEVRRVVK
ncbi:WD repeats and SOF1 domain containing-like protein [Piptocephalis cylindrospora]|uniref:WD repeats and SOF1 domain containing-like protein n=1 Tax=Piptocephalis cylindrospora TaxID=1907219 RepID=A0A4P9Y015_9FUNG|nr:WD repeats and SOF1 domain containing-like protein [Piptocephalis cylindrospora]|eukprot:RKP12037.1 WD repeats and SOF1 domain containing-like protein [Piptocephalis cylindrospora]